MATRWGGRFEVVGSATLDNALDLSTPADKLTIGSGGFDSIIASIALSSGTGSGAANQMFHDERTLATTATDSLDLAGGLTNPLGATITFSKIKLMIVAIVSPDGTKALRIGPNNTANAWQGWFGGTGANVYETVYDMVARWDFYGSWTSVTAGTGDLLIINNPSAGSVTYNILLVGTQ